MRQVDGSRGYGRRLSAPMTVALAGVAGWLLLPSLAFGQVLAATKTVSGTFTPGGSITYTIVGSNMMATPQGDNPGDEFVDVLPAAAQLVSATATTGTAVATIGTNTVTWNGVVASGGSVTVTITATIASGTFGQTISNQGLVNFDGNNDGTNETATPTDDPGTPAAFDPTSFTVPAAPMIVVQPTSLAALVVNTPVSQAITATGGDGGPYTFAVSAGTLPAGLVLNGTSGLLTGTPTTAGAYAFTIQATDASAHTGTRSYTGSVSSGSLTYFLAEGATGSFFDEDLSIANPNGTAAPITVTFLPENAAPIVQSHTLPAQSRLTIRVDDVPGLANASTSAQITSTNGLPLAVERTMFWDSRAYGGHTETAVPAAATRWLFAEGAQGFFETFVLIANPQTSAVDVTLTFLREDGVNVTAQVQVPPQARRTVAANGIAGLAHRAFGIVVDATQPVVAERAMYFGSTPTRPFAGGHGAVGVTAPSTTWFHAEASTGVFFDSFILLANPQSVAANVNVRYLLSSGVPIDVPKVVPALGRLTINIDSEADTRLHQAAVAVAVTSDQPIVSERSMYWTTAEGAVPWGEAHNSFGATAAGPRWALAEGRAGGSLDFRTVLLLSNAGSTAAQVTVTYLPETGAAIARTYQVPATSRFTIDVGSDVPQLAGQRFGASIATAGDVPIVVERSMYWNGDGLFWSGGTNALGTRLP